EGAADPRGIAAQAGRSQPSTGRSRLLRTSPAPELNATAADTVTSANLLPPRWVRATVARMFWRVVRKVDPVFPPSTMRPFNGKHRIDPKCGFHIWDQFDALVES